MSYYLKTASKTDQGKVYDHNEDSVFSKVQPSKESDFIALLIVADGVGGHKAGEVASKIVVDTLISDFKVYINSGDLELPPAGLELDKLEEKLVATIKDANRAIYEYSHKNENQAGNLGSTVTAALVIGDQAIVANVGDSRTYHFHDGQFEQISMDHSLVGEMVRKGIVKPEDIYTHPHRSVITRAIGNEADVDVDTFKITLKPGNRLLLCSDGLWEMIRSSKEISDTLYCDNDLNIVAEKFITKANQYGGKDNIGVVVAEFNEI